MAIYGIGAYHNKDVSEDFIRNGIVGVGWGEDDAPELKEYFISLKVGDIVYIKSAFGGKTKITIKAIGIIKNSIIVTDDEYSSLVSTGREVAWIYTDKFEIKKPKEKNNVRLNTIYEEFHPNVQNEIIKRIAKF